MHLKWFRSLITKSRFLGLLLRLFHNRTTRFYFHSQNRFGDKDYLGFEELTLVPFEPNLIKYELLTKKEVRLFNLQPCQLNVESNFTRIFT